MAYDIFFLSFGEPSAERHWHALHERFPYAQRVDGIAGIGAAHRHCAALSATRQFFVVDADNEVLDFDFGYWVPPDDRDFVHLWYARNPVNGLTYGWGGIKLFPKATMVSHTFDLDMTTSLPLKVIPVVASVTHYNTTPFDAWRSAFRECVKLVANRFPGEDAMTAQRLATWCVTAVDVPFAEFVLAGANQGRDYGQRHIDSLSDLCRINDFAWLRQRFDEQNDYPAS